VMQSHLISTHCILSTIHYVWWEFQEIRIEGESKIVQ
jgi:hypothetical protein